LQGYDAKTGVQVNQVGEASSVGFTPEIEKLLDNPNSELVLHHNHPNSAGFSTADLNVVATSPGLKQFFAHGHNDSSFSIGRINAGKQLTPTIVNQVTATVNNALKQLVQTKQISAADAAMVQTLSVPEILKSAGFVNYTAETKGLTSAVMTKYSGLIGQLVSQIVKFL
jgi:hypothetical protein